MVRNICLFFVLIFLLISCRFPVIHDKKKLFKKELNREEVPKPRLDEFYYYVKRNKDSTILIYPIQFFDEGYVKEYVFINAIQDRIFSLYYSDTCANVTSENTVKSALVKTECYIKNYDDYFGREHLKFINKNLISGWGRYKINGDSIKNQYYYNYKGDYYLSQYNGILYKDSIVFKESNIFHVERKESINETYLFRQVDLGSNMDVPKIIKKVSS